MNKDTLSVTDTFKQTIKLFKSNKYTDMETVYRFWQKKGRKRNRDDFLKEIYSIGKQQVLLDDDLVQCVRKILKTTLDSLFSHDELSIELTKDGFIWKGNPDL